MDDTWESWIAECSNDQLSLLLLFAAKPVRPAGPRSPATPEGEALPEALRSAIGAGPPRAGSALQELQEARTTLSRIQQIKRTAKQQYAIASDGHERGGAALLYHASIAAAYVRHGVVISSRPIAWRSGLYEDLAAALGPVPLGQLFRRAAERIADAPPGS